MGSLARAAAAALLVVVVLKASTGLEDVLTSYELNLLYVGFGFAALATYAWREEVPSVLEGDLEVLEDGPVIGRLVVAAIASLWLVGVMAVLDGPGFPEANRALTFGGIFLLVLAYPLIHHGTGRLLRRNWPYLLAFAVLFGVYLLHGANGAAGSPLAAFPVAVGFVLAMNLFVVPRYVGVDDFLWAVNRVSAAVVLLGLLAYVVGEYTALFLPVQLWPTTFSPPLLPVRIRFLQSVFENPNATGILAFVGTVAALVEFHRRLLRVADADGEGLGSPGEAPWARLTPVLAVPAALLAVNGLGLYLTYSRASILAAGAAGVVYLAYAGFGPDVVPGAAALAVGLVVFGLALVASGILAVGSGGRFVLWSAGVEALLRAPSLLGAGITDTGHIIEPYVTDPNHAGSGVHNSYLTTAIRAGLLGGAAHLVLAVGSVVHALATDRVVRTAPVALGLGFAVHQLFESYTLFQHSLGAVLASLTVGYVLAAIRDVQGTEPHTSSLADVYDGRADRSPGD